LRSRLNRRIGATGLPARVGLVLWTAAIVGVLAGWGVRMLSTGQNKYLAGALILATFGGVYLLMTMALGVPEALSAVRRLTRRR
jgi:hypothetical protein